MKTTFLLLILLLPILAISQDDLRWERIKPINAQTELPVNDSADLLLIEDGTDTLKKSIAVGNLSFSIDQVAGLVDTINYNRVLSYESEIGYDGQTTIDVPWTLKTTSLIFYERKLLAFSEWSGVGTTTLTLLFDTKKYEYAIIKR